jgi:hypothetical protein
MHIYQLVESPCVWNPYGIKMFATKGNNSPDKKFHPIVCFVDGPCCKVRFL